MINKKNECFAEVNWDVCERQFPKIENDFTYVVKTNMKDSVIEFNELLLINIYAKKIKISDLKRHTDRLKSRFSR